MDPLAQLVDGGGSLTFELGARFGLLEQLQVLAHMTACTEYVALSRFKLKSELDCLCCDSDLEETAEHAYFERVRLFWNRVGEWTARIETKQLVLLDVGYAIDNVLSTYQGEKRVVFLATLAVPRMVIWMT